MSWAAPYDALKDMIAPIAYGHENVVVGELACLSWAVPQRMLRIDLGSAPLPQGAIARF